MRSRAFSVPPFARHLPGARPHVLKGSFRAPPRTGSSGHRLTVRTILRRPVQDAYDRSGDSYRCKPAITLNRSIGCALGPQLGAHHSKYAS